MEILGDGCDHITTALLLAAGSGRRLRPLTDDQPKCLTEIDGVPILERMVDRLLDHGIRRLVVVVGHLEHTIRKFLELRQADLSIDYVVNSQYRTTNNIYSLWLARDAIQESFLLLESDLFFEPLLLGELLQPNRIAVSLMQPWMNGSTVSIDRSRMVQAFQLGETHTTSEVRYKTVNICSLSLESWYQVIQMMDQRISRGEVNEFYESVFAEMVNDRRLSLQAVLFDPAAWYEIDTLHDLQRVESLFESRDAEQASPA